MIELACHDPSTPLQAKTIAARQGIPARFIEQVLQGLKQAGIVRSLRGAQGGYSLAEDPSRITLAELVRSMTNRDPALRDINGSTSHFDKQPVAQALLSNIWAQVQEAEQAVLEVISLQSLVEQYQKLESQRSLMYHI